MMKLRARLLLTLFAVAFLTAMPLAQATTEVGSQNPQLTVRASAASDGADPDRATVGDKVTVSGSVRNNTPKQRSALVTVTVRDPQGSSIYSDSDNVILAPHQRISRSFSYWVDESYPKGNYDLTVSATNARGTSSATANLEIY
jgi:hypothetical protein